MHYQLQYTCISHQGLVRKNNQDNFICCGQYLNPAGSEPHFPISGECSLSSPSLFGVFDGMGGEEKGEMASLIAARAASELSLKEEPIRILSSFCQTANEQICSYAEEQKLTTGTTAALLLFTRSCIGLCNIGDTRIFRFRDHHIIQLSKDHVDTSVLTRKPPLVQNLGISPAEMQIDPYFARGSYKENDLFLICSDGLTDMLSEAELSEVLTSDNQLDNKGKLLKDLALKKGGLDNLTLILCQIHRKPGFFLHKRKETQKNGRNL